MLLLNRDYTVTVCHSKTSDLRAVCRENDVIQNEKLTMFRLSTRICSINIDNIEHIRIFMDYRKLNFRISSRQ